MMRIYSHLKKEKEKEKTSANVYQPLRMLPIQQHQTLPKESDKYRNKKNDIRDLCSHELNINNSKSKRISSTLCFFPKRIIIFPH